MNKIKKIISLLIVITTIVVVFTLSASAEFKSPILKSGYATGAMINDYFGKSIYAYVYKKGKTTYLYDVKRDVVVCEFKYNENDKIVSSESRTFKGATASIFLNMCDAVDYYNKCRRKLPVFKLCR